MSLQDVQTFRVPTIDEIDDMAKNGLSAGQIASRLNKSNCRTATGGRWYDTSVVSNLRKLPVDRHAAWPKINCSDNKKTAAETPVPSHKKSSARKGADGPSDKNVLPKPQTRPSSQWAYTVIRADDETKTMVGVVAVYDKRDDAISAMLSESDVRPTDVIASLPTVDLAALLEKHEVKKVVRVK